MKILLLCILCLLLTGCAGPGAETIPSTIPSETTLPPETIPAPTEGPDPVEDLLTGMAAEEKVGQLLLARCSEEAALADIEAYHLGGFVLFARDFENETPDSAREKFAGYQAAARIPLLLAVDEEGGSVTRISRFPAFRSQPFPSPREACREGGMGWALVMEDQKGRMLQDLGLNVLLGPVCDLSDDPAAFMYDRALGQSPEDTGNFAALTIQMLARNGVGTVLKHFPGYGSNADTHVGLARDSRSLRELEAQDLLPFAAGIEGGAQAILVGHIITEAFDTELPASLSPAVHSYLREAMGFDGVILTDDLVMDAITDQYGPGEAAVLAVLAGNDLLCSTDYGVQYEAVLDALNSGRIDQETLDTAVRRVLRWKQSLGLIPIANQTT